MAPSIGDPDVPDHPENPRPWGSVVAAATAAVIVAAVVVAGVVMAAAAVRAAHGGLDVAEAGAQAGEAADALEAGAGADAHADGPALAVAQAEGAGVAIHGDDRAFVLAGLGGGGGRRSDRQGGRCDEDDTKLAHDDHCGPGAVEDSMGLSSQGST